MLYYGNCHRIETWDQLHFVWVVNFLRASRSGIFPSSASFFRHPPRTAIRGLGFGTRSCNGYIPTGNIRYLVVVATSHNGCPSITARMTFKVVGLLAHRCYFLHSSSAFCLSQDMQEAIVVYVQRICWVGIVALRAVFWPIARGPWLCSLRNPTPSRWWNLDRHEASQAPVRRYHESRRCVTPVGCLRRSSSSARVNANFVVLLVRICDIEPYLSSCCCHSKVMHVLSPISIKLKELIHTTCKAHLACAFGTMPLHGIGPL